MSIDTPTGEPPLPAEIDASFGTDGRGRDFFEPAGQIQLQSLHVTPGNAIVWTGTDIGQSVHVVACRYTPAGKRDTTWAGDGCAEGANDTFAADAAPTAAGLIVAGGTGASSVTSTVWRYTNEGVVDTTFGNAGTVTLATPPFAVEHDGTGVALATRSSTGAVGITRLDDSGGVVDAGAGAVTGFPSDLVRRTDGTFVIGVNDSNAAKVVHVTADLDSYASKDVIANDHVLEIVLQPDASQLVLYPNRLTRETPGGLVDASFGTGGTVSSPTAFSKWFSMAVLADGRIAVVGGEMVPGSPPLATLWLYKANGSLDTGFADNGILRWPFRRLPAPQIGAPERLLDVAVAADGSLIVLGDMDHSRPRYAFVSRVLPP